MKKLFYLFVLAGLFFFGCSDVGTNVVNQPVTSNKTILKMPAKSGLDSELGLSISKNIDGSTGGILVLTSGFKGDDGSKVGVFATLKIPRGAFDGNTLISMSADLEYAGLDFAPHMVFNKPLSLNLAFSGLNLEELGIKDGSVGFYNVDNGNLIPVPNSGVFVNYETGTIRVVGAQIDHFSRYAFAQ
ncbi:MAG: hypothetical protein M1480_09130 [Bacteroidetes bacterium]|nr:hypothetical protein [Bacteroidota bacterium]